MKKLTLLLILLGVGLTGCQTDDKDELDEMNVLEVEIGEDVTMELGTVDIILPQCDVYDENETYECVVNADLVNVNQVGSYLISIRAFDLSGNEIVYDTRNVNIVDTVAPVIIEMTPLSINLDELYTLPLCSTLDNSKEEIICDIDESQMNSSKVGTYYVIYSATDSSGKNHFL